MKRLVICCDGTWNRADQEKNGVPCPTNVVRLAYRTAKRDGDIPQIVHYDQGVGTGNFIDRISGGAFGEGLEDNIHDAYRFLIANYEAGDELYVFGFSRGAFTARSLVGMVRKCGIVRRGSFAHYRDAVALYRTEAHPDAEGPLHFRRAHSVMGDQDIKIKLIGVWDTVGSLGIPLRGLRSLTRRKFQFHDTELSGSVEHAYHALAIDEHRTPFEPTLWTAKDKANQVVEQMWFCGSHSDVGGGYTSTGLADIALDWMLDKARTAGLALDADATHAYPLHPQPTAPINNSKIGFYRFTSGIDRPIGVIAQRPGALDPTQSVHESVRQRWDNDSSYRPAALRSYFQRTNDPRGV